MWHKNMALDDKTSNYTCSYCGYKLCIPINICHNCFTINNFLEDTDLEQVICKECGSEMFFVPDKS